MCTVRRELPEQSPFTLRKENAEPTAPSMDKFSLISSGQLSAEDQILPVSLKFRQNLGSFGGHCNYIALADSAVAIDINCGFQVSSTSGDLGCNRGRASAEMAENPTPCPAWCLNSVPNPFWQSTSRAA